VISIYIGGFPDSDQQGARGVCVECLAGACEPLAPDKEILRLLEPFAQRRLAQQRFMRHLEGCACSQDQGTPTEDGARIISGSGDQTVRIWDAKRALPSLPSSRVTKALSDLSR
jgi:hypothetical protein